MWFLMLQANFDDSSLSSTGSGASDRRKSGVITKDRSNSTMGVSSNKGWLNRATSAVVMRVWGSAWVCLSSVVHGPE